MEVFPTSFGLLSAFFTLFAFILILVALYVLQYKLLPRIKADTDEPTEVKVVPSKTWPETVIEMEQPRTDSVLGPAVPAVPWIGIAPRMTHLSPTEVQPRERSPSCETLIEERSISPRTTNHEKSHSSIPEDDARSVDSDEQYMPVITDEDFGFLDLNYETTHDESDKDTPVDSSDGRRH